MGFLSRLSGSKPDPTAGAFVLEGGRYSAISGESHYQDDLRLTAQKATWDEQEERLCFDAVLMLECDNRYDPKAVAVHSERGKLGYAPRGSGWFEVLDELARRGYAAATCRANLTGGTEGKFFGAVLHADPARELEALEESDD